MFAFALYDMRQDLLFLARDRLGEKPLHYYHKDGDFVFASEIKSMFAFPAVGRPLSLQALHRYLTFEYIPAPYTIFQDIHKLEPGHYLLLKQGRLTRHRYWSPSYRHDRDSLAPEDYAERLRALIRRSVAMRTVSDVPLGAFLSGGIDSSLITAFLVQTVSGERVKTFNIAFDEPSFDESGYAREVAGYLGTQHHEATLTTREMLEVLPDILRNLDEPFADASMIPTYLLSRYTRQSVTVALSGDGGDELFAGYPTYPAHKVARWIPRWLGRPSRRLAELLPVSDDNISFDFKVKRFTAGLPYPAPVRHQIWLGSFEPRQKSRLFTPDAYALLTEANEFDLVQQQWEGCDSSHYLDRVGCLDLRFYLQDNMLFKVDRASMANSLEVRVPFLAHPLVEFVCAMPSDLKLRGLTTKYILKKMAAGVLPDRIIHRKKKGFGIPVAKWIKSDLRDLFRETFSVDRIKRGGLFDPSYVQRILEDHLNNRRDNRKLLWTLFVFERWREQVQPVTPV
jgi:asparagine synthase (glutamine-hydrolysing)